MRGKEQIDQRKKRIEKNEEEERRGGKKNFLWRASYVKQITLLKGAQVDWEVLFDIDECEKEFPVHHSHGDSSRTLTSTFVVSIMYDYTGLYFCSGNFNE